MIIFIPEITAECLKKGADFGKGSIKRTLTEGDSIGELTDNKFLKRRLTDGKNHKRAAD